MKQTESPAIRAIQEIKKAVIGKDDCIIKVMTAILAGGHILIEDVPGVGKTTLALSRGLLCVTCFWRMRSTVLHRRRRRHFWKSWRKGK